MSYSQYEHIKIKGFGPSNARIMVVGEAPGESEIRQHRPFVGSSGKVLDDMLAEVNIPRASCFITNVSQIRPNANKIETFFGKKKDNILRLHGRYPFPPITDGLAALKLDILRLQPDLILTFGGTSLWALTGKSGIQAWRGSVMYADEADSSLPHILVVPTWHPSAILRDWGLRATAMVDLRRAKDYFDNGVPEQEHEFILRPTFGDSVEYIQGLLKRANDIPDDTQKIRPHRAHGDAMGAIIPALWGSTTPPFWVSENAGDWGMENQLQALPVSVDIESRGGFIACLGLAPSIHSAISIPFISVDKPQGFYTDFEEWHIKILLRRLLSHPKVAIIGQNFIYDAQYLAKELGGIYLPFFDTMSAHHVCFPDDKKALYFIASLFAEYYRYWKDEGKEWDSSIPEDQYWHYNCLDCTYTYEVAMVLWRFLHILKRWPQWGFQMCRQLPLLKMMLRGVAVDLKRKQELIGEVKEAMAQRQAFLDYVIGRPFNPRSAPQMQHFFYTEMGLPIQKDPKTGRPSLGKLALPTLKKADPLVAPIIKAVEEFRTLGSTLSNVLVKPLDWDDRLRCSYNPTGTKTFRLSSSQDAFYFGMNLQNLTEGKELDDADEAIKNLGI